jgi:hypothetical protein
MNSLGDKDKMSYVLWTLLSLISYVGGLIIVVKVTPHLMTHSFDEGLFMGWAILDIVGALLSFGAVFITLAVFNGAFAIRVVDFLLLLGILLIAARLTFQCLNPRVLSGSVPLSRVLAGSYGIFLILAAFFCITQLCITK